MRNRHLIAALSVSLAGAFALGYWVSRARAAGIPSIQAMTYSGMLTDTAGTPLAGPKIILVQFFDAASAGNSLCNIGPASVPLVAGAFQVPLPDACTAAVHASPNVWVDVSVDGASVGRSKLGAVPYAVEADTASNAAGALAEKLATIPTLRHVTSGFTACQPLVNFRTAGATTNLLIRASLYLDAACTVGANDPQTCHQYCAARWLIDPANFDVANCCGNATYYTRGIVDVLSY